MRTLLNTLYVFTRGAYLRLEGETVCVEVESEKKLQVPLHHLGSLVLFGDVLLTSALIHRCAEDGRSIEYLSANGDFKARVVGPVSGNVLLRQAQYQAAADEPRTISLARSLVAAKVRNSRQTLMRSARESERLEDERALREGIDFLKALMSKIEQADNLETLRGLEGEAAASYFSKFSLLLKPEFRGDFSMPRRSRRPPLDPVNALLSFLYTLLMNDCRSAVETVGLDPQVGFLHSVRPGRPSLALDLMEEFRSLCADRLIVTLINRGQVTTTDFQTRDGGAVMMSEDARRVVVGAYQERKQEQLSHPLLKEAVPMGLIPHLQARILARVLRHEMEGYLPFVYK